VSEVVDSIVGRDVYNVSNLGNTHTCAKLIWSRPTTALHRECV